MNVASVLRRGLPACLVVAILVFGVATAAYAEDVTDPSYYDEVVTEVVESFPEPSAAEPEPAAAGGLATEPPPTAWDRVVASPCMDPEPLCEPLP